MTKLKTRGKKISNGHSYQQNWKGESKRFNLMCVVRLLIKISTVVVGVCILKKGYASFHLLVNQKENKLQYRNARITGLLKRSLRATEKYAYCLATFILPQEMAF